MESARSIFNPATDQIHGVTVYDIDMFDTSAATVAALHAHGDIVIAYIDVGTAEDWRPDYSEFPAADLGDNNGWPGEKWLNIADTANIEPILEARIELAKSKGFDAVEPDNIDGWENKTGFNITASEQLTYNEWIATAVHAAGMSVGLKNDIEQAQTLEPYFDWDLDEQAYQYDEWSPGLLYFINAGKAVFEAEYTDYVGNAIPQAITMNSLHINSTTYDLNLVSPSTSGYVRIPCIPDTQNAWTTSVGYNSTSLVIVTVSIPNAIGGTPYSQSLSASGGVGDYTWTIIGGALPDNFTLSNGGVICGETVHAYPPSPHTYTFTVQATDTANNAATQQLSITVNCPTWDVNDDGIANISDVVDIGLHLSATLGSPYYAANCDVDGNGVININDIVIVGLHWNQTW